MMENLSLWVYYGGWIWSCGFFISLLVFGGCCIWRLGAK